MVSSQNAQVEYREFSLDDVPAVKVFTDKWIGDNYYSEIELETILLLSCVDGQNASFTAWVGDELAGIRLTYAPGNWLDKTTRGVTPELWPVNWKKVAYFKSLFIDDKFQKMGIGSGLSNRSIEVLKKMGTKGIICHSWLQSPGNSSQIYLQKLGFGPIKEHLKFWYPIDYECPVCTPDRCVCTALEMMKYI